ncbi:YihY/virulence factor BrkB family protein [Chelativorans sp. M5D2P16]|uniref:YihY/virulence factor BrkB family protein n=1 Tax=Chelativorans sp. M5D2P16 TaxID=3095678 RepID=UPI002ACAD744|nr:YihY/virulence factor BrkB family protein [Chelativorans sp. M5D2P16]MDZ5699629.1 YihY/virulence factor BrkB family protein [Chelativorans sp. M5D2P16]
MRRSATKFTRERISLVAAGITFYLILALFPALAAFVSLYGFFADPQTVADHLTYLEGVLPAAGLDLIREQLNALTSGDPQSLGLGFLISFALAFWSANNGIKALFQGMNVAYGESEKRGFFKLTAITFACTIAAMFVVMLLIAVVGVVPAVLAFVDLGPLGNFLAEIGRWILLLFFAFLVIAALYRIGPSREKAQWQWVTFGGVLAVLVWLAASIGFSFYLRNFADYNATYGSLGAAIGFMIWIWISVLIVLVGAELNAEMEHQTSDDTTTGPEEPMGQRGAVVADTVAATPGKEDSGRK